MTNFEDESNDNSLDGGVTNPGGRPADHDEMSLGGGATYAGGQRSRSGMSLGDEGTLGDKLGDQETVIDDFEVVDLEARYRTESTLGRGGMGEVLLAVDTRLDRKVAIKRILGEAARSKTAVERFLTEAKSIAALNHPNVVQIYDYGRAKDGPFLIMEYVDGSSLLDRCREGAMPLEEAVDLTCQLCDGLAKAHDQGIVHRDIKPANVMLTTDGLPKLTDFGLAKADASDHQMTMTGAVLGTPDFMPPEQRRDAAEVDARSDLWSLAATLYQMVTGRSPKIIRFDLLPESLTSVLGKALEESKNDRFQAAREFRDALKASLTAAEPAAADLGDGQCPSCGVKNESSRRFCRGCGESLEAPCLACDKPMPMWEEICGQCGGKQTPLVEQRRGELAVLQSEAESLLKEYRFEEAEQIVVALRDEPDPRLKQLVPWATEFLPQIAESREAELARAGALLQDALKHEASYDYPAAASTLALVPEPLIHRSLPGCSETVDTARTRVEATQADVKRLETLINQRISQRQLTGLLAEVHKLAALRPDRESIRSLQTKLRERDAKLLQQRDDAIRQAEGFLAAKDYASAVAVLRKVDQSVITDEVKLLRSRAEDLLTRLQSLLRDIQQARTEKRYDGMIEIVQEAIALSPDDAGLSNFLASLKAREDKIAAGIGDLLTKADEAFTRCDYKSVHDTLSRIPVQRQNDDVQSRLGLAKKLKLLQSDFRQLVENLPSTKELRTLDEDALSRIARNGRAYLAESAAHNIVDPSVTKWCESLEAAVEKQRAKKAAAAKVKENIRRALIAAGAVAAVVALLVIGFSIRSARRASSLRAALAAKQWQQSLEIDPTNVEAFLGLARDSLAANPPDVEGAFENANRAADAGADAATVTAVLGQAHAQRAMLLTEAGKLVDAAADYLQAEQFGVADSVLAAAGVAIGKGWLSRGQAAVEKGDASGVSAAIEQAGKFCLAAKRYGAASPDFFRVLKESYTLLAKDALTRSNTEAAIGFMVEIGEASSSAFAETIATESMKDLREDVAVSLRKRFSTLASERNYSRAITCLLSLSNVDPATFSTLLGDLSAFPADAILAIPPITNPVGMEFKLLPAGEFMMGDENANGGTKKKQAVPRVFFMGVTEVTNEQYSRVMGGPPGDAETRSIPQCPVDGAKWDDAVAFCKKLSAMKVQQAPFASYRLPRQVEWEYACRAGSTTNFWFGTFTEDMVDGWGAPDRGGALAQYCWFKNNSPGGRHGAGFWNSSPVRSRSPNPWGLYDMHGNVWEWCSDSDKAGYRVCRGGCASSYAETCRSASRDFREIFDGKGVDTTGVHTGFRVILQIGTAE